MNRMTFALIAVLVSFVIITLAMVQYASAEKFVEIMPGAGTSDECAKTNECVVPFEATIHLGEKVTWFATDNPQPFYQLRGGLPGEPWDGDLFTWFIKPGNPKSHMYTEISFDPEGMSFPYHDSTHPWIQGEVVVLPPLPAEAQVAPFQTATVLTSNSTIVVSLAKWDQLIEDNHEVTRELMKFKMENLELRDKVFFLEQEIASLLNELSFFR